MATIRRTAIKSPGTLIVKPAAKKIIKDLKDVPMSSELEAVITQIKKNKGQQTVCRASEVRQPFRIRTGIFLLDYATLGGIPFNRTTMFIGARHSGKSTAVDKVIAAVQKACPGQKAVKIDTESTSDEVWSRKNGVDTDDLVLVQPDTGEDAVDMAVGLVHAKETSLVVIDSLASLVSYKEVVGSAEDEAVPGLQAKLITRMLRRITMAQIVERKRGHYVSFLVTNQFRCLDTSTRVWTRRGLITMGEVQTGDFVESPSGFSEVRGTAHTGHVTGLKVSIKDHGPLLMSRNHRHMVVGRRGRMEEVLAEDLDVGDWVMLSGQVSPAARTTATEAEAKEAAFLGMYFADGCVTASKNRPKDRRVSIGECSLERRTLVQAAMLELFDGAGSYKNPLSSVGAPGIAFIDRHGAGYRGASKRIPELVRSGRADLVREFLRHAAFDSHGIKGNRFIWTFECVEHAGYVAALLRVLGIMSSIKEGTHSGHLYSYLYVSGDDAVLFRDRIGFAEDSKQAQAQDFEPSQGARGKYDVVPRSIFHAVFTQARVRKISGLATAPHYAALSMIGLKTHLNASRTRLLEFAQYAATKNVYFSEWVDRLERFRWAEVCAIEDHPVDAVDIEVEGGLFFADGVLTHNSQIGGWSPAGEPRSLPGGKALGHFTSLEVCFKNKEVSKSNGEGAETLSHNEHAFKIEKNKMNAGMRSGEYRMLRRDDPDLGLNEADVDDASTMLSMAKRLGWYKGGGKGGFLLEFADISERYDNAEQAVRAMYEHREIYETLRIQLIVQNALDQGMPTDYIDYLLGN